MDLDSLPIGDAIFVAPMDCLAVPQLPNGSNWVYEIKLDGYRVVAINSNGRPSLFSKNRRSFNRQYPYIIEALSDLPQSTVIDGEVVALDDAGRPDFNLLQHSRAQASRICYFAFDLLVYQNHDLTRLPFTDRRQIMSELIGPTRFQSLNTVLAMFGFFSLFVAALNLIPAPPLDGALAWGFLFKRFLRGRNAKSEPDWRA